MNCEICFERYNDSDKQPYILIPCSHSFCISCIEKLDKCATCRSQITGKFINRGILNLLDLNLIPDPNTKLKDSIIKSKNELKELKGNLISKINEKKRINKGKLNEIENEITDQTIKLHELIEKNKNDLLIKLKDIEENSNAKFDFLSLENEINILLNHDMIEMNKSQLINLNEQLQNMKNEINKKIDFVKDYHLVVKLEPLNINSKNFIGELIDDKSKQNISNIKSIKLNPNAFNASTANNGK